MAKTPLFLSLLLLAAASAPAQEGDHEAGLLEEAWRGAYPFQLPASHSYLGVAVEEIDSARAKELKLKEERGVEITRVSEGSPAEKAGLKVHDVVLEYNGQRVEGTESFIRMVRETPVGHVAKLLISRDGNTQTVAVTIGRRKSSDVFGRNFRYPPPVISVRPMIDMPRPLMLTHVGRVGIEAESVSGQFAEYFGVKEGVLVRSVDKGSPGEKAGLKAGDVIVKVDGQKVAQTRDFSEELRSSMDRKVIPLQVVRNKKELTLNLELPERAEDGTGRLIRDRRQL
jgi:serine protease Do